jgi:hypothetical protein
VRERRAAVVGERAELGVDRGGLRPTWSPFAPSIEFDAMIRLADEVVALGDDRVLGLALAVGRMERRIRVVVDVPGDDRVAEHGPAGSGETAPALGAQMVQRGRAAADVE